MQGIMSSGNAVGTQARNFGSSGIYVCVCSIVVQIYSVSFKFNKMNKNVVFKVSSLSLSEIGLVP